MGLAYSELTGFIDLRLLSMVGDDVSRTLMDCGRFELLTLFLVELATTCNLLYA